MIRFVTYLIITVFGITVSLAQVKTEEILIKNEGVELPGTLKYTKEKSPLIIFIHGSGGINRVGGASKMIEQFGNEIVNNNIAFFSYDKRSSNPKNVVFLKQGILFNDFVSDAKKVIDHFKKDKRFTEITLVGHSQGSLIGILVSNKVDKYVSLAGAGETIDKTIIRQITNQNAELGKITASHIKELKETGEIKEVNPNLLSLFAKQNQPFFRQWISINPTEEIKKVKVPTLIINGDRDLQVLVSDAKNLHNAKPNSKLVIIKNMNHQIKHVENKEDNYKSYSNPNFLVSKKLIETIVSFVKK